MRMMVTGLASLAVVVPASEAAAQVPTRDSVTGNAEGCLAFRPPNPDLPFPECGHFLSVSLNASSGPAGENPSGTVIFREHFGSPSTDFITRAVVTCLSVSGNVAIIGVTGQTQLSGPEAGLIRVRDGGPAAGQDTYQFASVSGPGDGPPLPGPTTCSSFPGGFPAITQVGTNAKGDLSVVDAPAVPTTKPQCKNGGWRTYGVFKNQGDCVSFVASGGKNPPANNP
jgi:hypothetical protein